jgi:hypothetical protein
MSDRQHAKRWGTVPKALAGLAAMLGCLGAVAYAAAPRQLAAPGARNPLGPLPERSGAGIIPAPEIVQRPNKLATSPSARFSFSARRNDLRFQCRLDRRGWKACRAPVTFTGLLPGSHRFLVRALDDRGRRSAASRFRWRLLEPKDFSIQPQLGGLAPLYPGAPAVALPLMISNPNPVPIFVTSLTATATADPLGCTSAENLLLTQSNLSSAVRLKVPAGQSVSLPAAGISPPAIQLRNLPVNQDACQRAQFPLAFSGSARG